MGESRQELVAWLNNLLQLNITKVEQCGTGYVLPVAGAQPAPNGRRTDAPSPSAALCQVFDSIFYDVPMSRVKFNANTEYAYLQNFKVLQSASPLPPPPPAPRHSPPLTLARHVCQAPDRQAYSR